MAPDVRVITFNCAAGNPRITTPQAQFLELPFYGEAFAGGDGAPLLALQEVGTAQARALGRDHGTATVLQRRRPGLGNALVIPDRYELLGRRSGYYVLPQLRGIGRALRAGRRNWRQYGELRMWIRARLRDTATGRELTVMTTHISADGDLKVEQIGAVVRRARTAAPPVILAGDFNVPSLHPRGLDVAAAARMAQLDDVGSRGAKIDYVLAAGLMPVSARVLADILEQQISDHAPEEVVLAYA
jgi:endonuclease/exonuclease/phosphatase family metal-dependent hydrolase